MSYSHLFSFCYRIYNVSRGTETEEQVNLRLANAEIELLSSKVEGLFDKVLVNDNYDDTVNAFFRTMRDW